MKKQLILILSLCFLVFKTFSQRFYESGYIVNLNGDTIKGSVRDVNFYTLSQFVYFKEARKNDAKPYSPTEIKAFFIAPDHYFEAHIIPVWKRIENGFLEKHLETKFVRKVVSGKLSLFQYDAADNNNVLLIQKDKGNLQPLVMSLKKLIRGEDGNNRTELIDSIPSMEYLPAGQDYVFGKEYLKTFINATREWKDYQPTAFPLNLSAVKKEVMNYNNVVQPNSNRVLSKGNLQFTLSGTYNKLYNSDKIVIINRIIEKRPGDTSTHGSPYGYQVALGVGNKSFLKGFTMELGYAYQKRAFTGAIQGKDYYEYYDFDAVSNIVFLRACYSLIPASRISPYVFGGFGVGSTVLKAQTTITTELATGGIKDDVYRYDKSAKLIQEYVGIGLNLYISKGHALKVEYSPIAITIDELPLSASLRMGYQISF